MAFRALLTGDGDFDWSGAVDDPTLDRSHSRRRIVIEIIIVLALSFGRSGVYSIIQIIDRLTLSTPLSQQTTSLNNSVTPDRPWLDLTYQVYYFIMPMAETALVLYLLHLAYGQARRRIGFDLGRWWPDVGRGWLTCAVIGIPGLAFYLLARLIGINATVVPANLSDVWWRVPVLLVSAAMAGISEEVVMLGYLVNRLRALRWSPLLAIVVSAAIRGSYHLYQGFGGFLGNVVMGVVFGLLYLRWKRVMPLVIAHTLIDCFAFVGYSLIAPYISWL
ncbi:MAG: CPBP family intramembrane metalloprotease [Propionibacteriaceae bacterium]|jgi:membrane protease YdiL (CAAX protease family)|nr:CPBP family intramembrane metalloprotease [Propionibacteriaceae bacterium]